MPRPTQILIDLQALRNNFALACSLATNSRNIPIIKANAYGHGMVEVAHALSGQAPAFGVASIQEALTLREAGIKQPILLLEGIFTDNEIATSEENNFWLTVENRHQLDALLRAKIKRPLTTWLKIDTGMHRLGIQPDEFTTIYQQLKSSNNIREEIIVSSHFACADEPSNPLTKKQIQCFEQTVAGLQAPQSLANSAGILAWPEAHRDWNRPGIMLYGSSPFNGIQNNDIMSSTGQLQAVMTFKSAVISVRRIAAGETVGYGATWTADQPATIATVAVGYGDGYPRHAPNGTPVLVNGVRCPLAGRVSMDMITIDVSNLEKVAIGDEVILWGSQLPVNEIADSSGTIGYELLTRIPARPSRTYLNKLP